jgi:LysM repeat protein
MRRLLVLFVLLHSSFLWAQPGISSQKEVNGVMFYVHTVEDGNSLWGLQRVYGVEIEEILKFNPGLTEGLSLGQEIVIPVSDFISPQTVTEEYKVKKGETLYGLSRKFDVSLDTLIALNPELVEGLKRGQKLKIPKKKASSVASIVSETEEIPNPFVADTIHKRKDAVTLVFSDSIVSHTVRDGETLYSISRRFMVPVEAVIKQNNLNSSQVKKGQQLKIIVKRERIEIVPIKAVPSAEDVTHSSGIELKNRCKIAVLLPFFLDIGPGYSKNVSDLATQFYMGATMAIDSLEAMGMSADVYFFDTRNDTNAVKSLLAGPKFAGVDMIVGPFFPALQKIVARYCSANGVKMIIPVSSDMRLLENNKTIYASVPSQITLIEGVADYILKMHQEDKVILVKPTLKSDLVLFDAFRNRFNQERNHLPSSPSLVETTLDQMKLHLTTSNKNVLVFPVLSKSSAIAFMDRLNNSSFRAKKGDITVFGMKEWVDFTEINNLYKNKFNMHFGSSNFVDYYSEQMIEMNRKFRASYQTDMSKMAIQAYDVFMFYCSSFLTIHESSKLLMNKFSMESSGIDNGFENKNVFIVEQIEYELFDTEKLTNE